MAVSLDMSEMSKLDEIVDRGKPLQKGHFLCMQGTKFESVFAIKSGSVKTYITNNAGEQQITGFYFPGDLIGLNSIHTDHYESTIQVLETTSICQIPFEQLDTLSAALPKLRRQILKTMSKEICNDQNMLQLLANKNANERLASFLIQLSERFKERGFSESRFRLSMSRNDIANYLGLTVETVSRGLTKLHKNQHVIVENKEIEIKDFDYLYELSNGKCE